MTDTVGPKDYFETIFGALQDPIAVMDETGTVIDVNPAYAALFGKTKIDLIGRGFLDLDAKADQSMKQFIAELFTELREHRPVQFETHVTTATNAAIWFKVTASLLEYRGQALCLTSLHDISDRRRIESGLRKSGEKLRRIFQSVSDGIIVTDIGGVVTEINQKALEMYGYSLERDVVGKHLRDLSEVNRDELERITRTVVQRGILKSTESKIYRGDGTELIVELSVSILRTSEDEPQGFVAILRDVTARKETEELYKRVVTDSPIGIYVAQKGKFQFVNPRFQENSGYDQEELLRMSTADLVHPEDRQLTRDRAVLMVKGQHVPPGEFRIVTKDGQIKWAMETISSIFYQGRRASLGNFVDITERHNAEIALRKALDASEKSENRFRDLYNQAPVAFFAVAANGLIQTANDKAVELLGFSIEELVNTTMVALFPETHFGKEKARTFFIKSKYGKTVVGDEVEMQRKDGQNIWVSISIEPVSDDDGRIVGSRIAALDITDRKEAEIALEASQSRFRQLADLLPLSVWEINAKGQFLYANKETVKSYGYTAEETERINMFDRFAPDDRDRVLRDMTGIISNGVTLGAREYCALRKNGETFPVLMYTSPIVKENIVSGLRGISIDITERKQAEAALLRSEGRARSVTETATDAIISIDSKGRVILWNPAAERMFGFSAAEMAGQQVTQIMQPENRTSHADGLSWAVSGGEHRFIGHTVETVGLRKSGEHMPIELSLAEWSIGEEKFFTAIIRDITERKKIDAELSYRVEELQEANRRLKDLDKLKDSFLSIVSHELRTPLASIKGFAELLLAYDEDKATQREFIGIINDESDRLTRLINDFLDLSKIESGRMQWVTSEVSLQSVIETALHVNHSLVAQNKLEVLTKIERELPLVLSDKDRITQVVTNLLSNAIKFTPEGGRIIISAESTKGMKSEGVTDMVTVSVADSGIGIAPENHKRIFEKFIQVGDTLKDRPKGTGLGLPICKDIVEHYGGSIWVESQLGTGSIFRFTLPVATQYTETVTNDVSAARPVSGSTKTILIVDDEANIRRSIGHAMTGRGYVVIEAASGREAIDLARRHHPNLITMDVVLPDLDGLDVTAVLKNDPLTKDIPILIVSVFEDKSKAYRLGANDYITKPFNVEGLLEKVSTLLGGAQKTILLVDDDRNLIKSLEFELRKRGFTVYAAYRGAEALQLVERHRPNLILLDIKMPEMDGYELLKALKGDSDTLSIPIVLMTGVNIDGGRVKALSIGATDYFNKSDELGRLFEAVERILGEGEK